MTYLVEDDSWMRWGPHMSFGDVLRLLAVKKSAALEACGNDRAAAMGVGMAFGELRTKQCTVIDEEVNND